MHSTTVRRFSELRSFSPPVPDHESNGYVERSKTKQILGRRLSRNATVEIAVTDLDFNAPNLGYLSLSTSDDKIPSYNKARVGFENRSSSVIIVSDDFDLNAVIQAPSYLYPLETIAPILERNRVIDFKDLNRLEHLVYGSNSSICSARLKKEGPVIVKIIKEKVSNQQIAEIEFEEEHKILCRLSHPHVMGYFGKGYLALYKGRRQFLVLEKMEGGTLNALLNQPGYFSKAKPLAERRVLQIALEFADALKYLHDEFHIEASVIHRDLKPDNIAFTSQGVLKLIDFGLATCVRKKKTVDETYLMTGNTGSLRYMAPEVCLCVPYNEKVDIYSYGLIIWQAASSIRPFGDMSSHVDFVNRVALGGERPPLPTTDSELKFSPGLAEMVSECWNKDYKLRPSAVEIVEKVRVLLEHSKSQEEKQSSEKTFTPTTCLGANCLIS